MLPIVSTFLGPTIACVRVSPTRIQPVRLLVQQGNHPVMRQAALCDCHAKLFQKWIGEISIKMQITHIYLVRHCYSFETNEVLLALSLHY